MALSPPFEATRDGVRIAVKVTPKASRAGIAGIGFDADGRAFLKLRVNAPPEGGKANAAVIKLLARAWKVAPSRLTVIAGAKDRRKTLRLAGDGPALVSFLEEWFENQNA